MKFHGRAVGICQIAEIARQNRGQLFRMSLRMLRNAMLPDYRFLRGRSYMPNVVTWEITNRCNLRCAMCWLWGESGIGTDYAAKELTTMEITCILEQLASFKPHIYITGGEPFVREDLLEIVGYIKSKGCLCTISSNGTLISNDIAEQVVDSRLDAITLSIDGPETSHDAIRGSGAFRKVINAVADLNNARKTRNKQLPLVQILCTISPGNYRTIDEVASAIKGLGVDRLTFQHLWCTTDKLAKAHKAAMKKYFAIDCHGIDGYINANIEEMSPEIIHDKLTSIKNDLNGKVKLNIYPDFTIEQLKTYYTAGLPPVAPRCVNPWLSASVRMNGDLTLCPDYYIREHVLGNLRDTSFRALWNSQKARSFRTRLKQNGCFPGCRRCCGLFAR